MGSHEREWRQIAQDNERDAICAIGAAGCFDLAAAPPTTEGSKAGCCRVCTFVRAHREAAQIRELVTGSVKRLVLNCSLLGRFTCLENPPDRQQHGSSVVDRRTEKSTARRIEATRLLCVCTAARPKGHCMQVRVSSALRPPTPYLVRGDPRPSSGPRRGRRSCATGGHPCTSLRAASNSRSRSRRATGSPDR